MSERLKSVKVPFSSWQSLTHMCAMNDLPRTKQLAVIIDQAERIQLLSRTDIHVLLIEHSDEPFGSEAWYREKSFAILALIKGQQK